MLDPSAHPSRQRAIGAPVFICGHPRSGTTLLKSLLTGHPDLLVFPQDLSYLRHAAGHPAPLDAQSEARWILSESHCQYLPETMSVAGGTLHRSEFEEAFRDRLGVGHTTPRNVMEAAVTCFAEQVQQEGRRYWVEKTPGNEHHLLAAQTWLPEMRAIYLVRDPRDVYLSHKRKREQHEPHRPVTRDDLIVRWGRSLWDWRQFTAQSSAGLLVRFEELLQSPRTTLGRICQFLDIPFQDSMLRPEEGENHWTGNSSHQDRFEQISTKPIGRWRELAMPDDIWWIEAVLGHAMEAFGYRRSCPRPSLARVVARWMRSSPKRKQMLGVLLRLYWPFALPERLRGGRAKT